MRGSYLFPLLPMSAVPADYPAFLTAIKQRVRAAQYQALQLVNREQMQLYWDLGRLIADRQQYAGWGKGSSKRWPATCRANLRASAAFRLPTCGVCAPFT